MLKDWIEWAVRIIASFDWYIDYLEALALVLLVHESWYVSYNVRVPVSGF